MERLQEPLRFFPVPQPSSGTLLFLLGSIWLWVYQQSLCQFNNILIYNDFSFYDEEKKRNRFFKFIKRNGSLLIDGIFE
jgi:hypothetical protein